MNIKRTLNALTLVILMTLAAIPVARAASEPWILQQRLDPNTAKLTLYARHTGGAEVSGINIGGTAIEDAVVAKDASETTLVTWILFDNSKAMPEEIRSKASDLLLTLLGEKGRGETYNFCTFSDKLSIKLRNSNSFADLKKQIDGIEYYDQQTYLMGAVDEVLAEEGARTGDEFVRIVIISAGGDSIPTGKTMENLRDRLAARNIVSSVPIYTIGCNNGSNSDILPQMYALSTQTHARYWNMDEVGASDIAKIMHWEEIPVKASLTIPSALRTGTEQEINVTFSDGTSARGTVIANPGPGPDPIPDPVPDPIPDPVPDPIPDPKPGLSPVVIGLIVALVLVLAGGGAAFFLLLRKKEEPWRSTGDPVPVSAPAPYSGNDEATDFADVNSDNDATIDIFGSSPGDNSYLTLYLTDLNDPDRYFSASLRNRVSVGRSPDNVISLGYDKSISRRHCEIYYQNGELWIQDSGSSGGTYIGNDRVVNATELPNNSTIRLGHVSYRVEMR
ncbi:MAG: FHA domain-containing protein [Oscillibacter sp.]|nr:FHA domain-containing protein [Oscillibacter sp.]